MKRLLVGLSVVVFLGIAAFLGWWFLNIGYVSPGNYLPEGTLVYGEIPNGTKTFLRYEQSKLKTLIENPEYQALFVALGVEFQSTLKDINPADLDHAKKAGNEFLQSLGGASFVAVTRLDLVPSPEMKAQDVIKGIGAIAGFRNSPDHGDHLSACLKELTEISPDKPKKYTEGSATHGDLPYTYIDLTESGVRLCRMHWKEWDLFSFGEQPLFDFVDRVTGKIATTSLTQATSYQGLTKRKEKNPDAVVYIDENKIISVVKNCANALNPNLGLGAIWDKLDYLRGSLWTMSFQNGDILERCDVDAPKAAREKSGVEYQSQAALAKSISFTSPTTVLYFTGNFDGEAIYNQQMDMVKTIQAAPASANPYDLVEQGLKGMGLDLRENLLKAIGPEIGVVVDWPPAQDVPDLMLLVEIKNSEKFSALYDKLTLMATPMLSLVGTAAPLKVGDFTGLSLAPKSMPQFSPTLFKGSTFWGLSLNSAGASRLLASSTPLSRHEITGGLTPPGTSYSMIYGKMGEMVRHGYLLGKPYLGKYLADNYPSKNWTSQLPTTLTSAPLLGDFHSVMNVDGDYLTSETNSPTGTIGLGLGIMAGIAVPGLAKSPETIPALPVVTSPDLTPSTLTPTSPADPAPSSP